VITPAEVAGKVFAESYLLAGSSIAGNAFITNLTFKFNMKYTLFSFVLLLFSVAVQAQGVQPQAEEDKGFFIGLYSGERIYANKIQMKSPLFKGDFFLLDDSLRYPTNSIKYYQNRDGFFVRVGDVTGRNAFAKRIMNGRIAKYYTTVSAYNDPYFWGGGGMYGRPYGMYSPYGMYGPYGAGGMSSRRIYFFSKDDGPLQEFNLNNLTEAMADNAGSMQSLRQYRTSRLIETGLSVVGAGLLVYGMSQSVEQTPAGPRLAISPAAYAGIGVSVAPLLMRLFKKDKLNEAIELYNYQQRR
jgi:hypothetical protein